MADTPFEDAEVDLLEPDGSPERRRQIVRAWIGLAATEARATRPAPVPPDGGAAVGELDRAVDAAFATAVEELGAEAGLTRDEIRLEADRLAELAQERGVLFAANVSSAPISAVLFALADRAHAEAPARPQLGQLLGRLLIALAPRCPDARGRLAADLEAAGWTAIADGHFRASEVVEADQALARARQARERGTEDPLLEARYETAAGNVRADQSRFRESLRHARNARRIYDEIGQPHEAAKARVRVALQIYHLGQPLEGAIREIELALGELKGDVEPRAVVAARQNLARFLAEAGRLEEAENQLPELRRLASELGNPYDPARVEWLAAHVAALRGDYLESKQSYRRVIETWNQAGFEYDAALATLELTAVLLALGETDEVRRNAEQLLPVFRGLGIAPEALATLQLVAAAARRDALERALVEELVATLRGRPRPGAPVRG